MRKKKEEDEHVNKTSYYDHEKEEENREKLYNDSNDDNNEDKDNDDEYDYLLDEDLPDTSLDLKDLEDRRRAELEMVLLHYETMYIAKCIWASASLDYCLEQHVAPKARGTKFIRSGGRATLLLDAETWARIGKSGAGGAWLSRLDPDRDLPAVVAIRDGVMINICPRLQGLTQKMDSEQQQQ